MSAPSIGSASAAPTGPPSPSAPPSVAPSAERGPTDPAGPRPPWIRDDGASLRAQVIADRWSVRGAAKVTGNVEVDTVEIDGALSIGGTLRARRLTVHGAFEVLGMAQVAERVELRGPARFSQGFHAGDLDVEGALAVQGPLEVGGLAQIAGDATLAGDVHCGRLVGSGGLTVPGRLTADRIAFDLHRDSSIGTLLAGSVLFTRPAAKLPFRLPFIGQERPILTALRIEAMEVQLEGVTAELVRAERISLGPGCHVARVIGPVVAVDPSSHVGPESRSPPPHGISR
ncbi:MAG TPA: polymer-forming cytoskeletal protein [Thermoplasmata archaeon]|nr:polymer-forming cytoskeletal protein [Thermoplasmata archaeon]